MGPLLKERFCNVAFMQYVWSGYELQALKSAGVAQKAPLDLACRGPHENGHNFFKSQPNCLIVFALECKFQRGFQTYRNYVFTALLRYFLQPGTPSCMVGASGEVGNPSQVSAHTSAAAFDMTKKHRFTYFCPVKKQSEQSGP